MRISLPMPGARDRSGASRAGRKQRRWLLLALLALLVVGAIVVWRWQSSAPAAPTTSVARVSQGDLAITVSGSGTVAAARTVALPFQQAGTVTAVNVRVGDQVTAGQALATIDSGALELALQQAQASLAAAQANLAQVQSGTATAQDLASAQAQLESAKAQLAETRRGATTAAQLESAKAQLASAQAQLDALENPSAAALAAAQRQVDQANLALQRTRDSASQAKTNAALALENAVNSLTKAQVSYATAKGNWDFVQATGQDPTNPESTDATGKTVKNKLNDTQRQQYYDTFASAEAALKSAENAVTQAQVAYDMARQEEVTQIAQAEATVAEAQASLDALKHPTAADLAQARASVAAAQANLASLTQGATDAELAQAEASVTQAQANLDSLTAPATDAELAQAQASVLQAQANLDAAERNLSQATLTAPFDGVVASVDITLGSSTSTEAAAITIVDRSTLTVDVSLSESDIADVQVGQPVTLTFDAVPGVTLTGEVSTISPSATTTQNVVTYPVEIAFDPADSPVKVGMSATAEITVQEFADAILVPSRAVTTEGDSATVTVLQGPGQPPRVLQVQTGVTSDGQTVITGCVDTSAPCLKAGDMLQVASSTSATTTTQTTNQQRQPGMGGFGGGMGGPPPGP